MPVPSSISDLSTTAGSNSPAGTDSIGTNMDDYVRAHAAFIAQLYAAIGRTTAMTASRALITDASAGVSVSAVTSTELGYVSGVTSAIQTQLNGKLAQTNPSPTASESNLTSSGWQSSLAIPAAVGAILFDSSIVGEGRYAFTGVSGDGNWYFGRTQLNNGTTAPGYAISITPDGVVNILQGLTFGNVSSAEFGYLDGVTSSIQNQLNGKQASIAGSGITKLTCSSGAPSGTQTGELWLRY